MEFFTIITTEPNLQGPNINPIYTIILSGVFAAIISATMTHFSSKKLDIQQRTMEARKELYIKIINQLAFFVSTVNEEESNKARTDLLKYFRETQIWGSDEVVDNFKKLIDLMSPENKLLQNERDLQYKKLIISMRADILGKTKLGADKIDIRGFVDNK